MRRFFKKSSAKNKPVPDPIKTFNSDTGNNICSIYTSLTAIKGHHIEVRENTAIDGNSTIGSYTYIGMNSAVTKATVGKYCSIANNVSIGPGEHDLSGISTHTIFHKSPLEVLTKRDCIIGNDVWIGVDSIIKRGIKIGDGAVIGANSVVTKDVPPYAIVAGSPAKIIRYRFDETSIKKILASAWWNNDYEVAKEILLQLDKEINHKDTL